MLKHQLRSAITEAPSSWRLQHLARFLQTKLKQTDYLLGICYGKVSRFFFENAESVKYAGIRGSNVCPATLPVESSTAQQSLGHRIKAQRVCYLLKEFECRLLPHAYKNGFHADSNSEMQKMQKPLTVLSKWFNSCLSNFSPESALLLLSSIPLCAAWTWFALVCIKIPFLNSLYHNAIRPY